MEQFIYILTKQQTKMVPKIYSFQNTYEDAIVAFHNHHLNKYPNFLESNRKNFSIELYKFPIGVDFADFTSGNSNSYTKLGKNSKYRIKLKDWNELKVEYKSVNRNLQIDKLVG